MTWWISFAAPEGESLRERSLGVVIVDADDEKEALLRVKSLGLFPGGQVMFFKLPDNSPEAEYFGKERLISVAELESMNYRHLSELDEDIAHAIEHDPRVSVICEQDAEKL